MPRQPKYDCIQVLHEAGFSYGDAQDLRRISMTLHRWHELECGDSNSHGSWCVTRGNKFRDVNGKANFHHDESGKPFHERHPYNGMVSYSAVPDRERGALKRLAAIMTRYPGFEAYVQGDPRGAALYIMTPGQMASRELGWLEANYSQGIAVCK